MPCNEIAELACSECNDERTDDRREHRNPEGSDFAKRDNELTHELRTCGESLQPFADLHKKIGNDI